MTSLAALLNATGGRLRLLDRYLLRITIVPLAVALAVVLTALLMERLLRLFDLLSESGGRAGVVLELLVNLTPHYLGLALPAAFFFSVLAVATRLSENSEADALQACGVSVTRITAPLLVLGAVLAVVSLVVFGWLQPLGRYAYRAGLHAATQGDWTARVQPQVVLTSNDGFTMTADSADAAGRQLGGVFIRRVLPNGGEQVVTARTAVLRLSPDRRQASLQLAEGSQFSDRGPPAGGPTVVSFSRLDLAENIGGAAPAFRPRGANARELTLTELGRRLKQPLEPERRAEFTAERHGRLARALSLPLLPLLAVPLGFAAKRSQGGARYVIAGLVLLAYQQALQLGESLGDTGRVAPALAVWTPFAVFAALSLWLFAASRKRPGETPLSRGLDALGRAMRRSRAGLPTGRGDPAELRPA